MSQSYTPVIEQITDAEHTHCFACGSENPRGLSLHFSLTKDGDITGIFRPKRMYQGYEGYLHGGIICTLLDSAMTRLLMELGISAVTADLQVRFHKPVPIAEELIIRARMMKRRGSFFLLSAELATEASVMATAAGRFLTPKVEP